MSTDAALHKARPAPRTCKAFGWDEICVTISSAGTVTFRYSLALTSEKRGGARKAGIQGKSPAPKRQRGKPPRTMTLIATCRTQPSS